MAPAVRRFLKSNAATLGAVGGYIIALAVAYASVGIMDADRAAAAMSRFGNAMADDLAHLALDPLLRGDRIQLGLLTNRLAARAEVRRIAIHTVDEKLLVVAGGTAPSNSPTYIRPITVQDTVAGDVSVTLDPKSFTLPAESVLAESWQFAVAGLACTVFLFYFGSRSVYRPPARRTPEPSTEVPTPTKAYVVAADLPRQSAPGMAHRKALLAQGSAAAQQVANLYAGHAAPLPGSGVVLVFPVSDASDRCFEVICAVWLLRRLLASTPHDLDAAAHAFRYGIDFSEAGIAVHAGSVKAAAVSDVLLLASLAGAGEVVLGQTAYDALNRPDRVELEEIDNPATEALATAVAKPRGNVCGIADEYVALLERQSEVLSKAPHPSN